MDQNRLDQTLAALADPTRRAILARLAASEASVMDLAAPFSMSQPSISKHLKVLERAGLISRSRSAQFRPCRLEPGPLEAVADWVEQYRRYWEQSFDRLETYLAEVQSASNKGKNAMQENDIRFEISRVFNAPRRLVWRAWTEPERIGAWLGPKGMPTGRSIRHELHAGGVSLSAIKMPDGSEQCAKFVYREVTPFSKLVWVHSFADIEGRLVRHPMSPTWPLELLTTVTFAELGETTEVRLEWLPINADAAEIQTFNAGKMSMAGGWTGSFDRLAEYLAEP